MDNWYFIYDASGFKKNEVKDLSEKLERLGYRYNQCTGLGVGPGVEQIIAWIHNNQFTTDVSIGVLSNFIYDILKNLYFWFSAYNHKKKSIPSIEIFFNLQDLRDKNVSVKFKFRIDQLNNKKTLGKLIRSQTNFFKNKQR